MSKHIILGLKCSWITFHGTDEKSMIDFSESNRLLRYTKRYRKVLLFILFFFPYIYIYFVLFIPKTAFYRKQSDIFFEKIAQEKPRSCFSYS